MDCIELKIDSGPIWFLISLTTLLIIPEASSGSFQLIASTPNPGESHLASFAVHGDQYRCLITVTEKD